LSAPQAAAVCQAYRKNQGWMLIESAWVMESVWEQAAHKGLAFLRIIVLRLAQTLRHLGVTEFATSYEKDFKGQGFLRVWNPLAE